MKNAALKKAVPRKLPLGALDAASASRLLRAASDVALVMDGSGQILSVTVQDAELPLAELQAWVGQSWVQTVTTESRQKIEALLADAIAIAGASISTSASALGGTPGRWRQVNHPQAVGDDLPLLYTAVLVELGGDVLPAGKADLAHRPVPVVSSSAFVATSATAGAAATSATSATSAKTRRARQRIVAFGRNLRSTVVLQQRLVESQQAMERDYWRFREAETRYRHLFQTSAEAALIIDAVSQKVLEVNPAAQELCATPQAVGALPGKLVGASWLSLFDTDAQPQLQTLLASARTLGRKDALRAKLAVAQTEVSVSASVFRQDDSAFVLVRLVPVVAGRRGASHKDGAPNKAAQDTGPGSATAMAMSFLQGASDAIVLTDAQGRVLQANRAFAAMAQMAVDEQIRGQALDRWVGRTGVELGVLISNLRQRGSAGLFVTTVRGEAGSQTQVEIAASVLSAVPTTVLSFSIRNVERRLKTEAAAGSAVTRSVGDLTDLVGNVPLKDIVSETTDLIEQLCIETALDMTGDKRSSAALLLGLSRQSLYVKLRRFGIAEQGADEQS